MPGSIVLAHGVGNSHRSFWRVAADLAELGWTVRTVDLLGHSGRPLPPGATVADLGDDVVAQSGLGHVDVLLGHSLGAIAVLAAAARHPRFAGTVIIEDPPGSGVDHAEVAANLLADNRAAHDDPDAYAGRLLDANPLWHRQDADLTVVSRRAFAAEDVAQFIRTTEWNLPALVADCPVPVTLIVADSEASALHGSDRTTIIDRLGPEHVVSIVSGHGIHRDRPALWLTAVLAAAGK